MLWLGIHIAVPDRVRQPDRGHRPLGVLVPDPRPLDPPDHRLAAPAADRGARAAGLAASPNVRDDGGEARDPLLDPLLADEPVAEHEALPAVAGDPARLDAGHADAGRVGRREDRRLVDRRPAATPARGARPTRRRVAARAGGARSAASSASRRRR